MNPLSDEELHRQKVFAAMAETESLQNKVKSAPEGEPEVIPVDYFTRLLNTRTI